MLVDVTRLVHRMYSGSLSGIDRVELAYAQHFVVDGDGDACVRLGSRLLVVPRRAAKDFLATVGRVWSEIGAPAGDGAPNGDASHAVRRQTPRTRTVGLRAYAAAIANGPRQFFGDRATGRLYLGLSHGGLDRPETMKRMVARHRIAPVFLIHDLIPLTHPEYARVGHDRRHAVRMTTALELGRHLIANSATTARDLAAFAEGSGLALPPTTVAWLGIEACFFGRYEPPPADHPYFVCVGTIEPRKNHLLLLNLWRAMAEDLGDACPRLYLVGRRGWENEQIVDMLERCPGLRGKVIETGSIGDADLCRFMVGARGLLFPSFAEGYGLPMQEALALGVPIVASDIAAFAEIAPPQVPRLDPLDGPAWRRAIERLMIGDAVAADPAGGTATSSRPPSWADHFAGVDPVLRRLEDDIRAGRSDQTPS